MDQILPFLTDVKELIRPVMTFVARPEILLPTAAAALYLTLKYYRLITQPRVAGKTRLSTKRK